MAGKTLRMAGWCAFSKATLKNQKPFAVTLIEPFPLQFGHFTNAEMVLQNDPHLSYAKMY